MKRIKDIFDWMMPKDPKPAKTPKKAVDHLRHDDPAMKRDKNNKLKDDFGGQF